MRIIMPIITGAVLTLFLAFNTYRSYSNSEVRKENDLIINDVDNIFKVIKDLPPIYNDQIILNDQLFTTNDSKLVKDVGVSTVDFCSSERFDFVSQFELFPFELPCLTARPRLINFSEYGSYKLKNDFLYQTKNGNWFILSNQVSSMVSRVYFENTESSLAKPIEISTLDKFNKGLASQSIQLIDEEKAKAILKDDIALYSEYFDLPTY